MTATTVESAVPADTAEEEAKPRSKRRLLVVLALVLAVAGGGYVFLGHGGKPAAKTAAPEPGEVVPLEHLTINLADGHYLRVGLALQLAKGRSLGTDPSATDPAAAGARAFDEAINVFGDQSVASLTGSGREKFKATLLRRLKTDYDGAVIGIYFTEFVMQ